MSLSSSVCNVVASSERSLHVTVKSCEERNRKRARELMWPGCLVVEWLRARILVNKLKRVAPPKHGLGTPTHQPWWVVVWSRLPSNVAWLVGRSTSGTITRIRYAHNSPFTINIDDIISRIRMLACMTILRRLQGSRRLETTQASFMPAHFPCHVQ